MHWEGLSFYVDFSYTFLFMNPSLRKWKKEAGNFNRVSPKGPFGPLSLLPISGHSPSPMQPRFHQGQAHEFDSLTCPLSKSLESHGSPILPKYGLRFQRVMDGGKHQGCAGTCRLWNAQSRPHTSPNPVTPSNAERPRAFTAARRATPHGRLQTPLLSSVQCLGT